MYQRASISLVVASLTCLYSGVATAQVTLPTRVVRVLVTAQDTGLPLAVKLRITEGRRSQTMTMVPPVEVGVFDVTVSDESAILLAWASGYSVRRITIPPTPADLVMIALERAARVDAPVIRASGEPLSEGFVRLVPLTVDGSPFVIEAIIRDGRVLLRDLAVGTTYKIVVGGTTCPADRAGELLLPPGTTYVQAIRAGHCL